MRILAVINSLGAGGAERVMSLLCSELAASGHQVDLLTFAAGEPFYPLDQRVRLIQLGSGTGRYRGLSKLKPLLALIRSLRGRLSGGQYDKVISFMDQANMLTLLLAPRELPVVASERVFPARSSIMELRAPRIVIKLLNGARSRLYRRAEKIVVLTEESARYFPASLRPKIKVIPNPVFPPPAQGTADFEIPRPTVISVARLSSQKRLDLLLEAFAIASKRIPGWTLIVFGEGPEKERLEGLAQNLGIGETTVFAGLTKTPQLCMREAELFALTSDYEGFPGALCEAMACGLAVLSTDCPTGPREIIAHGENGMLVPCGDSGPISEALVRLMESPELRQQLGSRASEICQRFAPSKIWEMWKDELVA